MKVWKILALTFAAVFIQACGSTSALRGCELDHPYHQAQEGFVLRSPAGVDPIERKSTYKVATPSQVAKQPEYYLTPADKHRSHKDGIPADRCLLHPPIHEVSAEAKAEAAKD